MSSIQHLSVQQLRQAADLKDKIQGLEKELSQLLGSTSPAVIAPVAAKAPKKKGGLSTAGRASLVAAQKARWAKIHAAKAAVAKPVVRVVAGVKPAAKAVVAKKKFTMSAAAKAKISAAAKARWAKIRAAKK